MNLFGMMDISGSALKAERVRAEVVAANMANSETTRTAEGGPYQRHHVVFSAVGDGSFGQALLGAGTPAGGVEVSGVIEDQSAPLLRFDPGHPVQAEKGMVASSLEILK